MLISESRFRRILQEEALRMLREQGDPSATEMTQWEKVDKTLKSLLSKLNTNPQFKDADVIGTVEAASNAWQNYKDPSSPACAQLAKSLSEPSNNPREKFSKILYILAGQTPPAQGSWSSFTLGMPAPALKSLEAVFEQALPAAALSFMMKACSPTKSAAAGTGLISYKIVRGDTLSGILNKYYNVPLSRKTNYQEFAKLFNIADANLIKAGAPLQLPASLTVDGKTYKRMK